VGIYGRGDKKKNWRNFFKFEIDKSKEAIKQRSKVTIKAKMATNQGSAYVKPLRIILYIYIFYIFFIYFLYTST